MPVVIGRRHLPWPSRRRPTTILRVVETIHPVLDHGSFAYNSRHCLFQTEGKSPFGYNYCSATTHSKSFTAVSHQFSAQRASTVLPPTVFVRGGIPPPFFFLSRPFSSLISYISCHVSLLISRPCFLRWTAELDWLLPKPDGFCGLSVFSTDRRAIGQKIPKA